jgi:hypothetical protein
MHRCFAPVVFPERFNFFGAAKESALNKRLVNGGDKFDGLGRIIRQKAK